MDLNDESLGEIEHLRPIEIPAHVMLRWREQAEWISNVEMCVLIEIQDLEHDCTPHRLRRCAKAARIAAERASEPYAAGARALAVELEEMGR